MPAGEWEGTALLQIHGDRQFVGDSGSAGIARGGGGVGAGGFTGAGGFPLVGETGFDLSKDRMNASRSWAWAVVGWLAAFPGLRAADFVMPAEGPVAFRRDKLPIDPDAMVHLSRGVESLARGLNAESAADLRGAAQMIALALALDPANTRARELAEAYRTEQHEPDADMDRLERSRARIWQNIGWLETAEAGADGQALAACLKDVIVISDPKNPKAAAIRAAGEKGAWSGWVPALAAFEGGAVAANPEPAPESPEDTPAPPPSSFLESASMPVLLWQNAGREDAPKWVLTPAVAEMSATRVGAEAAATGEKPGFALKIGEGEEHGPLSATARMVTGFLRKVHGKLPEDLRVVIRSKGFESSSNSKKRQTVSAVCAVLANAAITGVEPDAVVIGQVEEDGSFKLPTSFWNQIQSLGKGTGRRLILPAEAASVLPSLLALEKPEFFMQYEVLLAKDGAELLALCAKTPAEALASPLGKFREIRERMGTQDVRQYIGNSFVKQRLMAVQQEAPYHFSARALLVQASGNRPTLVARSVLASELLRAMEPLRPIVAMQDHNADEKLMGKVSQIYDQSRTAVDALERYTDKADQALFTEAREAVGALRNIERAARARGEQWNVAEAVRAARREFVKLFREFEYTAMEAIGEPIPRPEQ